VNKSILSFFSHYV